MKIKELTDEQIKAFCGIDGEDSLLPAYKSAAISFIKGYTRLEENEIDEYEDLSFVYLVLINDMSLNRDYTVNRDTLNPTVSAILNLHSRNFVTGVTESDFQ